MQIKKKKKKKLQKEKKHIFIRNKVEIRVSWEREKYEKFKIKITRKIYEYKSNIRISS